MKRVFFPIIVVMLLLNVGVGVSHAASLGLSLSSLDDLSSIQVGETVTIEVDLSGLDEAAGEQLVSLTASVLFPNSLLGTPTAIVAGSIVPNPGDLLVFPDPGQADAFFVTFSANQIDHITSNGQFFTFDVVAQTIGADAFSFEVLSLQADQFVPPFNNPRDVDAGNPLPFQVVPVPLPNAFATGIGLMLTIFVGLNRHRFSLRRPTSGVI